MLNFKRYESRIRNILNPQLNIDREQEARITATLAARLDAELETKIAASLGKTFEGLFDTYGTLASTAKLSDQARQKLSLHYSYRDRAEVALTVASNYPSGHYMEFGSEGMATFRSFLTAAHIYRLGELYPEMRFYAFDIFGDAIKTADANDTSYFKNWANGSSDKFEEAQRYITNHAIYPDQCVLKKGLFQKHFTPAFKEEIRNTGGIGFAFLDCNITSSYEACFDFIGDLMCDRSFIYMDEYYVNRDVPLLFAQFADKLKKQHQFNSYFVRNALSCGALYCLYR